MSKSVRIQTPLGIAIITGKENGIQRISITENEEADISSLKIPDCLENAAIQLQEYFEGERTDFDLMLNPDGTDFQKKVWNDLL